MKQVMYIFFLLLASGAVAQPPEASFEYGKSRAIPDSAWNGMTVRQKIHYCLHQAESYSQICSIYLARPEPDVRKFIYAYNYHLHSFGEYNYSQRQQYFLEHYIDSVIAYLEEDLFLHKNNLYYWDYLLRHIPAQQDVIDLLLDYWDMHGKTSTEPLNLLISLMIHDGFDELKESPLYKHLQTSGYGSVGKIPVNAKNLREIEKLVREYKSSSHVGYIGHWNRISDSQIFSATTTGDSLYGATRRLGDARLNSLAALPLLNYCIFHPELYFQICSNAGLQPRNYRKYIYTDLPDRGIDNASYSERQKKALLQKQDSCQNLLAELLEQGDCQEGLIILTNAWQTIPWLVKRHRMYGWQSGTYITTLVKLLQQNKGTGFDGFIFEEYQGLIKNTPANEKAILNFAMNLYRLKQQGL